MAKLKKIMSITIALMIIITLPFNIFASQDEDIDVDGVLNVKVLENMENVEIGDIDTKTNLNSFKPKTASITNGLHTSKDGKWDYYFYDYGTDGEEDCWLSINGYKGTDANLTIPSTIDGYKVRAIAACAFMQNNILRSVTIPDSIVSLGDSAFVDCTNLETVYIPPTICDMASGIFYGCTSLRNIKLAYGLKSISSAMFEGCTSLENINIPKSITEIGSGAFSNTSIKTMDLSSYDIKKVGSCFMGCSALESVILPNRLETIDSNAFFNCTNLKNIDIPNSNYLRTIENNAFAGCSSLEEILLPTSLQEIGQNVFSSRVRGAKLNDKLAKITVDKDNYYFKDIDGVLFSKDGNTLVCYPQGKTDKEYVIPDSVKEINVGAFFKSNIENLYFPKNYSSGIADSLSLYSQKENFTAHVYKDSYAEEQFKKNGINYKIIEVPISSLKLNVKQKSMVIGSNFTLKVITTPIDATSSVKWISSNTKVVIVDNNGKVTAKGVGKTAVTAIAENESNIKQSVTITVVPRKVKKVTLKSAKKGQATVTISKTAGAKKYEIYHSTKKTSGFKKVATTAKTKYVNKGLKSKKTYYYKVRGINGSYKGAFSTVKQVKVK